MHQKQVKVILRLVSIILVIIFLIKSNQLEIIVLKFNLFLKNQWFIIVLSYSMVNLYLVKRYRIYHKNEAKKRERERDIWFVVIFLQLLTLLHRYTNIKVGEAKRKKKWRSESGHICSSLKRINFTKREWVNRIVERNNSILN